MTRNVHLDPDAGFCTGVRKAIQLAENHLNQHDSLYCIGQIVHNEAEETRLKEMGMQVISKDDLNGIQDGTVMIRAHGEPPITYAALKVKGLDVIDATCPTVKKLQEKIRDLKTWAQEENGQIAIFGKSGHPEVIGLCGQLNENIIVIEIEKDINKIDPRRPLQLFCQTTQDAEAYANIANILQTRYTSHQEGYGARLIIHPSLCRQISDRKKRLHKYARTVDVLIFVSGINSANGKYLFSVCEEANPKSYWVTGPDDLQPWWFFDAHQIGVSGAASTPHWLLQQVQQSIETIISPGQNTLNVP